MIENGSFEIHIYKHEYVINHVKCPVRGSNRTGKTENQEQNKSIRSNSICKVKKHYRLQRRFN